MDINNNNFTFLMCTERCGSNFITKLLNNHSQICGPSTKHIFNPVARNYFRYQPLSIKKNWEALICDILNLFNASFSIWNANFSKKELIQKITIGDIKGLLLYIFTKEMQINKKQHVFIKEIKLYEFYPFLKEFFPQANFVYQVRDPRDMALSWKKSKTHRGGVIQAARQWKNEQQQYLKIKELEKRKKTIHFVKYEDLITDTDDKLTSLLLFLNYPFESTMLQMDKDKLTKKNANQLDNWKNVSKPVMKNNYQKYKKELTVKEIQFIETICYFEMKHLGYQADNDWEKLNEISNKTLNEHHQVELNSLRYSPPEGVQENMQAKKKFYEHIPQ